MSQNPASKPQPIRSDPEGESFAPRIVVAYCQHSVARPVEPSEAAERARGKHRPQVLLLPCSSKLQPWQLLRLLESGVDGIEIVGCPLGSCRHLVGSRRADRRVARVQALLGEIGLGAERVGMSHGSGLSTELLMERADLRAEAVRALGPNPMNGVIRRSVAEEGSES